MPKFSTEEILANLGLLGPEHKAWFEKKAAEYPDGKVPLDIAAAYIGMHVNAANLFARWPEFVNEAIAVITRGPHDAEHHPDNFAP